MTLRTFKVESLQNGLTDPLQHDLITELLAMKPVVRLFPRADCANVNFPDPNEIPNPPARENFTIILDFSIPENPTQRTALVQSVIHKFNEIKSLMGRINATANLQTAILELGYIEILMTEYIAEVESLVSKASMAILAGAYLEVVEPTPQSVGMLILTIDLNGQFV